MPHIGITCSYFDPPDDERQRASLQRYVAVLDDTGAQGEVLWLPRDEGVEVEAVEAHATRLAAQLDGLIVSGGDDLDPAMYGEEPRSGADIKLVPPVRPAFEAALLREMLTRGKPVLGICYGCQFFNVW